MRDAVDFVSPPDPATLASLGLDALCYTGNARPSQAWVDDCRTRGVVVTFVQETISTRSQQGFQAGVFDCLFAESRAKERGHIGSIAYVVSDGSWSDVWDASEYGRGVQSVATLPFFSYGAVPICESFNRGGPKSLGTWVPETWGTGTLITQVVGSSPITGTDLNHVHADYTGTTKEEEVTVKLFQSPSGIFVVDGLNTVDLAPAEVGAYEFTTGGPPVPIEQVSADILHAVSARLQSEGVQAVATAAGATHFTGTVDLHSA